MSGVRVRWRALAKLAVIVVAAVAALQVVPGLLRPPAPPPLAKDVGLPRILATATESRGSFPTRDAEKEPRDRERRRRARAGRVLPRDVISSVPHRHVKRKPPGERKPSRTRSRSSRATVPALSPPTPEPPPAPAPPARIEPSPPPPTPPPPPSDGSEEFAPH